MMCYQHDNLPIYPNIIPFFIAISIIISVSIAISFAITVAISITFHLYMLSITIKDKSCTHCKSHSVTYSIPLAISKEIMKHNNYSIFKPNMYLPHSHNNQHSCCQKYWWCYIDPLSNTNWKLWWWYGTRRWTIKQSLNTSSDQRAYQSFQ